jgi:hypothetical protein
MKKGGELEGKRPRRRSKHRWEDDIKMDLKEIGWECVDGIHLTQVGDRLTW